MRPGRGGAWGRGGAEAGPEGVVGGAPPKEWTPTPNPYSWILKCPLVDQGHRKARARTPAPDAIQEQLPPCWRVVEDGIRAARASQNARLRIPGRAIARIRLH